MRIASTHLQDPAIRSVECFTEGGYLRDGDSYLLNRSGAVVIVVFTHANGTREAVGVYCLVRCSFESPPTSIGVGQLLNRI